MTDDLKDILADLEYLAKCEDEGVKRGLINRIMCAAEAQRGLSKPVDTGPWEVADDGRTLYSDDFNHDVTLKIGGDFYSDEQRVAYAKGLATRLMGLPKEPPPGLLWSMATRLRHDFGIDADDSSPMSSGFTPREREVILTDMRRLYDEVSGHGFFKWPE